MERPGWLLRSCHLWDVCEPLFQTCTVPAAFLLGCGVFFVSPKVTLAVSLVFVVLLG